MPQVAVCGLWHLGCVTAACVARDFPTVGHDPDPAVVDGLKNGRMPIREPGLDEAVRAGIQEKRLRFTSDPGDAVRSADVVWITYDTPVDADDRADVGFVKDRVTSLFPHLKDGALLAISSQVPVGFSAGIEKAFREAHSSRRLNVCYIPENLRLGSALTNFAKAERICVGTRRDEDRPLLESLLKSFCERIEWMSVESAEMTKHALNSFLATSVVFANEIASICERVGADAREVARGLKSDMRIGPRAYLSPGAAFAGGTLARDVAFLKTLAGDHRLPCFLPEAVMASNTEHRGWAARRLQEVLGDLKGRTVAILGMVYKPGTNTLRRSGSVELAEWLVGQGVDVSAHDPAFGEAPEGWPAGVRLCRDRLDALKGADALVIGTGWPEFKSLSAGDALKHMRSPVVLDPQSFLEGTLGKAEGVRYFAVGVCSGGRK